MAIFSAHTASPPPPSLTAIKHDSASSGLQRSTAEKPTFYEQVTGVKGLVFVFSFISVFAFVVAVLVAPHVALHRVSMRTLMS